MALGGAGLDLMATDATARSRSTPSANHGLVFGRVTQEGCWGAQLGSTHVMVRQRVGGRKVETCSAQTPCTRDKAFYASIDVSGDYFAMSVPAAEYDVVSVRTANTALTVVDRDLTFSVRPGTSIYVGSIDIGCSSEAGETRVDTVRCLNDLETAQPIFAQHFSTAGPLVDGTERSPLCAPGGGGSP